MTSSVYVSVWQQFGAAIDMLDNAINTCPDDLWEAQVQDDPDDQRYGQFWFIAYHALFWTDLYLTGTSHGFKPPAPFVRDGLPDEPYTKAEVLVYLKHCRNRCKSVITSMTDEQAIRICTFEWVEVTFFELQIYSLRHAQEHAAQLGLVLARNNASDLDWVTVAQDES